MRPVIGITLDSEPPGGYSKFPWYAVRANYADAVAACGGLPLALPHHAALADEYLDRLDALIVTGGAFDVDPLLYGEGERHGSVSLKQGRTAAEWRCCAGPWRVTCRCSAFAAASSCWRWRWAAR